MAAITETHLWGWKKEVELHPTLETYLGEPLVKSSERFDTIDFESDHYLAELKCRKKISPQGKFVDSHSYEDWLVPVCKIARADEKEVWFFYFFEGDSTLWRIPYNELLFKKFKKAPSPCSAQLHFYIPKKYWEFLTSLKS